MIDFALMPASLRSASRIGRHLALAALPASTSPDTRVRSANLAFAYWLLSVVLADPLLRVSGRTAIDQACWVCSVGALDFSRIVCAVAWFAGAGGWFGALQQAVRADGQALQDVFV